MSVLERQKRWMFHLQLWFLWKTTNRIWLVFRFIRKTYTWWSPKSSQWKALRFSWKALQFSWKVAVFTEKWWFLLGNLINQLIQDKSFSFIVCLGEAMSDDSMKTATFHENHWFSWKVAVFTEKQQFSLGNLINQLIQDKSFSFIVCFGEAMSDDSMKTAAFHENRTKDHQLPGMVTLCLFHHFSGFFFNSF